MLTNPNANISITYYDAYSPYIILGDTKKAELLTRKPFLSEKLVGEDIT
jgi:hypothetical protein